ncbi:MAG: tRNA/rRNA methyltransferase [Thermococcaceae archaeon]|jgi:TrmH family RNA methyltransferase|uniref:SpoU protein n=1 Tax=Thermococcus sibiricus TaxID=172049 RepID=A0A101EJW1_9EURY|nr:MULTISPECIES: RNA methyltransferase [Thermococcus]MDK2782503.1 tRNA/rRNA methyltransferase [Thermococcaceae archaeon]KUK16715.1 MAG: SpoU protein [Thermococcus sibiricus]MCA6214446.1 RNA methyltransferase [Thermococcus bergensis]MDK2853688.1 tRNA/rRNA methyltransferase [Thermococcaceae archaeon]MDN5320354.1 tRNA/rRNA methyltransferase [Thermococcaceae archaeon]
MELAVILVEVEYPINLGAIARVMKNFGVKKLILVSPKVSPNDKTARKFAVHAVDVLENAILVDSLDEALKMVDLAVGTSGVAGGDYIPERTPITPEEFAKRVFLYDGAVGLVFGRESRGLDNEELKKLDFTVTIPTSEEYPVMNLSHAVAVILYELYKQRRKTEVVEVKEKLRKSTKEERIRLVELWEQFLNVLEYPKDLERRKLSVMMFQRFLGRGFIYAKEIHSMYGPLRKAIERLERCKDDRC